MTGVTYQEWAMAWAVWLLAVVVYNGGILFMLWCWHRYLRVPKWAVVGMLFMGGAF